MSEEITYDKLDNRYPETFERRDRVSYEIARIISNHANRTKKIGAMTSIVMKNDLMKMLEEEGVFND